MKTNRLQMMLLSALLGRITGRPPSAGGWLLSIILLYTFFFHNHTNRGWSSCGYVASVGRQCRTWLISALDLKSSSTIGKVEPAGFSL